VLGKRIKTGDLGIKEAEGFVRVTGRTKDLIIRGGVNIAPLEIDEVLLKHPAWPRPPRSACRTRSTAKRSSATWCRRTRR
jgi:acyl-CoA synthetase (AMP-forming)/AMP-acid ligase II